MSTPPNVLNVNPSTAEVADEIARQALAFRIPQVLLEGLAWRESGWRQWDETGKCVESYTNHVGILGVWIGKRKDADRLRSDWRYNIAEGARQLQVCWFRAPIIGDGHLEDSRDILESWYFALGRYGDGTQSATANHFADSVLDAVANGGGGRWEGVDVNRPDLSEGGPASNIMCPPAPWHFAGLPPLPPAKAVVSLNVPYVSQSYDGPDTFRGGGASCGPTSMTMILAYYHKIDPRPIAVNHAYVHTTSYGGYVPDIYSAVCEPGMGAIHAKMLDYFRPLFPNVAIWYHENATYARVKAELDAGRPCILGTTVTSAGHIMVARGYLSDGRLLVNDPAGNFYEAAHSPRPSGDFLPGGRRYANVDGGKAVYDWDALGINWVMTFDPSANATPGDRPDDGPKDQTQKDPSRTAHNQRTASIAAP